MIGRLQPGVSQKQALAQLNPIFQHAIYEGTGKHDAKEQLPQLYFTPVRGIESLRENYEKPLLLLMAMVGVVLVIACSNVAMLLVARNNARQHEFSLRIAAGSNPIPTLSSVAYREPVAGGGGNGARLGLRDLGHRGSGRLGGAGVQCVSRSWGVGVHLDPFGIGGSHLRLGPLA